MPITTKIFEIYSDERQEKPFTSHLPRSGIRRKTHAYESVALAMV